MAITLVGSDTIKANCTVSGNYSSFYGYKAWNGTLTDSDDTWLSDSDGPQSDGSCWIQWDFLSAVSVASFIFWARNGGSQNGFPDSIKVLGSDTGSFSGEETNLGTYNCSQPSGAGEPCNAVEITSPAAFRYYRVQILTKQLVPGQSSFAYVGIGEAEFTLSEATVDLKIDHEKIDSTLSDFPVMVNLAAYPEVFTALGEDANRKKITLENASGDALYGEIEHFDYSNKKGILWTKLPSVSDSEDTEFSLVAGAAKAVTAKSVIFDIADNYGYSGVVGIRSVDFYKNDEKITITGSDITAYATTTFSNYDPEWAFVTALSKTGLGSSNSWASDSATIASRLSVVFNTEIEFDKIIINNYHHEGTLTDAGAKNIKINISDDSITDTTYNAAISNSTEIFDGQIAEHAASNVADDQEFPLYVDDTGGWAAQQVWDDNFKAVYHMAQDPSGGSGCILDSTSNANHGTPAGSMLTGDLVDGEFGKALDFDGTDDYIEISDHADFDITDYLTLEAHADINWTTLNGVAGPLIAKSNWASSGYGYLLAANDSALVEAITIQAYKSSDNYITKSQESVSEGWQTICGVYDKDASGTDKIDLFRNGSTTGTASTNNSYDSIGENNLPIRIGRDSGSNNFFYAGKISEIRISDIARSAAWLKATYYSNKDLLVYRDVDIDEDYTKRIRFEINPDLIDSELTDFPVMLNLSSASGISDKDITAIFDELTSDANRFKIKVTTDDGVECPVEIAYWDDTTEKAQLYVKLPTVYADKKTVFYLNYASTASPYYSAKSVIIDFTNNWGASTYTSIRSVEFYKDGVLLPLTQSDYTAYHSSIVTETYNSKYAFDTSLSKVDGWGSTSWVSDSGDYTNQRIICVFNTSIEFDEIVINNNHDSGTRLTETCKDILLYISDDAITDTTYGNAISNSTLLFDGQIPQHVASNIEDPQYTVYGNVGDTSQTASQQVWDDDFKAIYHMSQDPSGGAGCILDSTSNANHGTPLGTMLTGDLVDGPYGKAIDFDGVDDGIDTGLTFSNATGATLEAIASFAENGGTDSEHTILDLDENADVWVLRHGLGKVQSSIKTGNSKLTSDGLNNSQFYGIQATYNQTTHLLYIDGNQVGTDSYTTALDSAALPIRIGKRNSAKSGDRQLAGKIAEVRVSYTSRSAAWVKATHYSGTDALITFGSEEAETPAVPGTTGDITATLPALTCEINTLYSGLSASLPALTCEMVAGAYMAATLPALTASIQADAFSFSGDLVDSLGALTMTGVTDQYREVEGTLPVITCEMAGVANKIAMACELPALTAAIHAAGHLSANTPGLAMTGTGFNEILAQVAAEIPGLSMLAQAGARISIDLVCPAVAMVGRNQVVTQLSATVPALRVSISGNADSAPAIAASLPAIRAALTGHSSAVGAIAANLQALTFSATAQTGIVGNLAASLPALGRCRISAAPGGPATLDCALPALELLAVVNNSNRDAVLRHARGQIR